MDDCDNLSESGHGLQKGLCTLLDYCELNNLKVNMDKTKIMSFKTRKGVKENKLTIVHGTGTGRQLRLPRSPNY